MPARDLICFLAAWGTAGDVRPLVALALALRRRGYEIALLADAGYEAMARGAGIRDDEWFSSSYIPADVWMRTEPVQRVLGGRRQRLADALVAREIFRIHQQRADASLERMKAGRDSRIAAAVASISSWGMLSRLGDCARIVASPMPYQPSRTFSLAPPAFFYRTRMGRWYFNRYRTPLGDEKARWYFTNGLYHLVSVSPLVFPRPSDWPPNMEVTGYVELDDSGDWLPSERLVRFLEEGDPPVCFGFGSYPVFSGRRGARLAEAVFAATARLGVRCLVQSADLVAVPHPPHVHVLDYAPHDWLFPRCSAIVHHGGYGTTHACLAAARPMVIYPFHTDQFLWAGRIGELGAGPGYTARIHELNERRLAADLQFALEPRTREAAERLGPAIRKEDGLAAQVAAVESIVEHTRRGLSLREWIPRGHEPAAAAG
jgi:sterol 3beta-glucosyltransferase